MHTSAYIEQKQKEEKTGFLYPSDIGVPISDTKRENVISYIRIYLTEIYIIDMIHVVHLMHNFPHSYLSADSAIHQKNQ